MAQKLLKDIKLKINLTLPAGKATPAQKVGATLGQHGLNSQAFCKEFNDKTKENEGLNIPVLITIFKDKSFSLNIKAPTTSSLLLKYSEMATKGASIPNKEIAGYLSNENLIKIAKQKTPNLNSTNLNKNILTILGTAKNMGIKLK